jgi:hypothetical protein
MAYNVCKYADKRSPDLCGYYLLRSDALKEIMRECERQDDKWGKQNHRMLFDLHTFIDEWLETFREDNNNPVYKKTWFSILMEEVCEAFAETEPEKQREEMVQVAAVAVQIIECLDRKKEAGSETGD